MKVTDEMVERAHAAYWGSHKPCNEPKMRAALEAALAGCSYCAFRPCYRHEQPADREASLQALGFEPLTEEQRANNILVNLGSAVQPAERDLALELFGDFRPAERGVDALTAKERAIVNRVDMEKYPYGRAVRDIADLRDVIDRLASELAKERESSPLRRVQELSAQLAAERAAVREVVAEMGDNAEWDNAPDHVVRKFGGNATRFWQVKINEALGGRK